MSRFHLFFRFTLFIAGTLTFSIASAAVHGVVRTTAGQPVAGATVRAGAAEAVTAADGSFTIDASSSDSLVVSHPIFGTRVVEVPSSGGDRLEIEVEPIAPVTANVTVTAKTADELAPLSRSRITQEEIERQYHGQDVPALLSRTPSVTHYSDAGIGGSGYSYFAIRGIDQKRVNITLDGVPLNDPAENVLYFANFTDFASSMSSIEVQRGIGITPGGAASYAGAVDFTSISPLAGKSLSGYLTMGSFGTRRGSVAFTTGELPAGFAIYGRVSANETDGFRDHSGVQQESVFGVVEKRGTDSLWRFVTFSGRERSELAYYAVDEETLDANVRFNPLAEEEVDDFRQSFANLRYSKTLDAASVNASVYFNDADGWFDIWDDSSQKNDLLHFMIDQQMIGALTNVDFRLYDWALTTGVHLQHFATDHALEIERASIYANTTTKTEQALFVKAARGLGAWNVWGDLQLRHARFDYDGGVDLDAIDWTMVNPKIGFSRNIGAGISAYVTAGRVEREPTRSDLLAGEDEVTSLRDINYVKPEEAFDLEIGATARRGRFEGAMNLYAMELRDEIQATGEINEFGLPIRRNVERSHRRGIEVDAAFDLRPNVRLTHASSFSTNRIERWSQPFDVYDANGEYVESVMREFRNVRPLLTPEVVLNNGVELSLPRGAFFSAGARYVGESHLDNTGDRNRMTPDFWSVDLDGSIPLRRTSLGTARLRIVINNLFDEQIRPSGYSYPYLVRDGVEREEGISYFYPAAGRNALVMIEFGQ